MSVELGVPGSISFWQDKHIRENTPADKTYLFFIATNFNEKHKPNDDADFENLYNTNINICVI